MFNPTGVKAREAMMLLIYMHWILSWFTYQCHLSAKYPVKDFYQHGVSSSDDNAIIASHMPYR